MKRLWLLALAAVLVALFYALELHHFLTFDALKEGRMHFAQVQADSPLLVAAGFFLIYVAVTALSLPGATILTLAAGALFGLSRGVVLVSFASSAGATLAFTAARYLARDWVQQRFGDKLAAINSGMTRDGALYLFTLRLAPVFPFFLINILMGLTTIRTRTFYWVSQLGMLAGTLVYVNAGTQLADLHSAADILSVQMLAAFALLGVFPLLARRGMTALERRRVYARWRRPRTYDRNLIVIGAGAAGLVAAYIAATVKARVTLIEAHKMGGDCLNYGCVPSKALIRSARLAHQIRHATRYGLEASTPQFSFKSVMARVRDTVRAIEPHDSVERYTQLGVEVLNGYARVHDPWTVNVVSEGGAQRRLTARSIVIAAGAAPVVPSIPGIEEVGFVTSETLWNEFAQLETAPERLIVLGGGPIGCELAQSFARLGSTVTQVEMATRIMIREDEEVSALARASLEADGVTVLTGHKALRCERSGAAKILVVEHDGRERRIEFDALLCAVGRAARLQGYGLEELGIRADRTIVTNEYLETLYPNIYAAGDVAGPYQLTHVASHQAWYATVNALFGRFRKFKADYSVIPWTTFIDPEVARVGLNEQEAREKGVPFEVTRYDLHELDRAIADSATRGFIKVLTVPGKDRILGVTIVGEHAGDLLAEYVLAMRQGLGLRRILGTIHTYPTLAEANKHAAGEWQRAHAPQGLLAIAERYHAWMRN
jgi:pyruvate/2-oxoglutarate dehydrogenase complex dihydrolipoamide dehydrogenase (E3) component/uncharacterized membrane protein YdjX (TVP38/TMEM64 family)